MHRDRPSDAQVLGDGFLVRSEKGRIESVVGVLALENLLEGAEFRVQVIQELLNVLTVGETEEVLVVERDEL